MKKEEKTEDFSLIDDAVTLPTEEVIRGAGMSREDTQAALTAYRKGELSLGGGMFPVRRFFSLRWLECRGVIWDELSRSEKLYVASLLGLNTRHESSRKFGGFKEEKRIYREQGNNRLQFGRVIVGMEKSNRRNDSDYGIDTNDPHQWERTVEALLEDVTKLNKIKGEES